MTIHNIRLPDDIEQGAQGGPSWLTTIIQMGSGQEQRNSEWSIAKQRWNVGYGVMNETDYKAVRTFFYARRGRGYGFLFRDWTDYQLSLELLGVGTSTDGSNGNADFQVIKTYEDSEASYTRRLTRPSSSGMVVTVAGSPSVNYTLVTGGIIRFTSGHHPTTGQEVRVSCDFDVPVRFDVDLWPQEVIWVGAASVPTISILELVE